MRAYVLKDIMHSEMFDQPHVAARETGLMPRRLAAFAEATEAR